jgi:hypothetical protein
MKRISWILVLVMAIAEFFTCGVVSAQEEKKKGQGITIARFLKISKGVEWIIIAEVVNSEVRKDPMCWHPPSYTETTTFRITTVLKGRRKPEKNKFATKLLYGQSHNRPSPSYKAGDKFIMLMTLARLQTVTYLPATLTWSAKTEAHIQKELAKDLEAKNAKIESLIKKLGSEGAKQREDALKELIEIGEPAIPFLKKELENKDSDVQAWQAKRIIAEVEKNLVRIHQTIIKAQGPVIQVKVSNFGIRDVTVCYSKSAWKMFKIVYYKHDRDKIPKKTSPNKSDTEDESKKITLKHQEHLVVQYDLSKSFPLEKGDYLDIPSIGRAWDYFVATTVVSVDGREISGKIRFRCRPAPKSGQKPSQKKPIGSFIPGEILVMFMKGASRDSQQKLLKKYDLVVLDEFAPLCAWKVKVPIGKEIELCKKLEKESDVKFAELNRKINPPQPPGKEPRPKKKREVIPNGR